MTADSLPEPDPVAARRPRYLADIAAGVDRYLEPRRTHCPWCDGTTLRTRLRTTDLLQHKPGRFTLDGCADCGHVFQNPRLTPEGLEFYYRDAYDGLGEQQMAATFEGNPDGLRSRAELVRDHYQPKRWLDVGTGHGHFCKAAAEVLPDTEFDGLDMTEGVEIAARNGWIGTAHRGNFVDMVDELAGGYDVISMFHYLEHTTDPRAELAAAAKVLPAGGRMVIELPDPECRWGRILGRWWLPWLQPQHLNLMPIGNLRRAAQELGFTVLAEQRAEAHLAVDLLAAVGLFMNALLQGEDVPWQPKPPSGGRKALRKVGMLLAIPVFVAAHIGDRLMKKRRGYSNAYRVLLGK